MGTESDVIIVRPTMLPSGQTAYRPASSPSAISVLPYWPAGRSTPANNDLLASSQSSGKGPAPSGSPIENDTMHKPAGSRQHESHTWGSASCNANEQRPIQDVGAASPHSTHTDRARSSSWSSSTSYDDLSMGMASAWSECGVGEASELTVSEGDGKQGLQVHDVLHGRSFGTLAVGARVEPEVLPVAANTAGELEHKASTRRQFGFRPLAWHSAAWAFHPGSQLEHMPFCMPCRCKLMI